MKCDKAIFRLIICIVVLHSTCLHAADGPLNEEVKAGRDYAAQLDQQVTFLEDTTVNERVNRIGQALAKIANDVEINANYGSSNIVHFDYTFKVIDDNDVNAFSLPGGYIYVNSGLMDIVESDDELAGALAHEIAHSCHHHGMQLVRKQLSINKIVALVTLVGLLANVKGQDLHNLLYGAQLLKTAKMSGHTMQAEKDADRTAIAYLARSKYNPAGMLSFMKKLDDLNDANPSASPGIYKDHPSPYRRVAAITKAMKEEGIQIDLSETRQCCAKTVPAEGDDSLYSVVIGKKVVFVAAEIDNGELSSKSRCDALTSAINSMIDRGLTDKDIAIGPDWSTINLDGAQILKIESADAIMTGQSESALVRQIQDALRYAVWAEWLHNRCPVVQNSLNEELD